jgi:hypothetical protein
MVVVVSCREGEDGSAAIDEFMVEVLSLSLCCFVWISLSFSFLWRELFVGEWRSESCVFVLGLWVELSS